jgi:hypothetical protein
VECLCYSPRSALEQDPEVKKWRAALTEAAIVRAEDIQRRLEDSAYRRLEAAGGDRKRSHEVGHKDPEAVRERVHAHREGRHRDHEPEEEGKGNHREMHEEASEDLEGRAPGGRRDSSRRTGQEVEEHQHKDRREEGKAPVVAVDKHASSHGRHGHNEGHGHVGSRSRGHDAHSPSKSSADGHHAPWDHDRCGRGGGSPQ